MAFDFEAERDCRRRSVKYATTRHVAREKSCSIAFLFPHSLYFYVHGMLASQLVHPLALARRAERVTYSCFQRNRGRRLGAPVVRAANINSGAESRRCEEHAQPATCRLSRRRRQQLLRQNQKAPPRKRVGYGWDDTTEHRKAKCDKHVFKLAQLGICQKSTKSEPRSTKSADNLE